MIRFLKITGLALLAFVAVAGIRIYHNCRDRHPGYAVQLNIPASQPGPLKAGFSAVKITPVIPDTWTDKNSDAQYVEADGDTYQDNNHNGRFDAYWMAGFQNLRPANGIHDDLWARAVVLDDGKTRLALVSLDVIGIGHNVVVNIRKKLPPALGISYAVVCNTHNHEAPDVIGMWGEDYRSGVDKEWLENLENQAVRAIVQATQALRPARLKFAEDLSGAAHLLNDTRRPEVYDAGLYAMQAIDLEADSTLGTLVCWGDHPETLWNKNLLITSDFPHYVREGIERGVHFGDKTFKKGLGGTVVYVSGCIGGLMTTDDGFEIKSVLDGNTYKEPSFAKAEAQGYELAMLVMDALEKADTALDRTSISLRANTFEVPLDNPMFKLGVALNVLDAGYSSWGNLRTETAAIEIGDVQMLLIPGEIYPEIVNGGVEAPQNADYQDISIAEEPPLRMLMKGRHKWVIGLANDEIGYIIPKTQWDEAAPYTYDSTEQPYGEINSVGPETAALVYKAASKVLHH